MGQGLKIISNAYAAEQDSMSAKMYLENTGGDKVFAKSREDQDRLLNESFRLLAKFGEYGKEVMKEIILNFEASVPLGGAIISPHAYRGTPYIKRTREYNKENVDIVCEFTQEISNVKNNKTELRMNRGSWGSYDSPIKASVGDLKKEFAYGVDAFDNIHHTHQSTCMEAANSINDIIALSRLYEEKGNSPLSIMFVGHYHPKEGLVINDPVYGTISHLRAMKIVRNQAGSYISHFGGNCGNNREGYALFLDKLQDHPKYYEQYTTIYPNDGTGVCVDHGCEFTSYDDNDVFISQLLEKHPYISEVGICCGNTAEKNKDFVGGLLKNGYTIG